MARAFALSLVLSLALAACGGPPPDRTAPPGDGSLLPKDRLALPEYDVQQYRALIDELAGEPVVVNFWGSWCPPCRGEAPEFAKVSREFEGRVQFLGVDILDNRRAARDFILEFDWPYPSIFDPEGEIRDGLGYVGQPITLVYDASGELNFEFVGPVNAELVRTEVRKVL
jgi:thiol-disulfide isomerase/thioredoxin